MEVALNSPRKTWLLATALGITSIFLAASTLQFIADRLSASPRHLKLAVRLAPGNAEYHEILGEQLFQERAEIGAALEEFRLATVLNPYNAQYWLALASAKQIFGDSAGERDALERAATVDPTTPDLAWAEANLFLAEGEAEMALRQFRVVVANDPGRAYSAFVLCSHLADPSAITQKVLPPDPAAYLSFIEYLTEQKNTAGAMQVWNAMTRLGKAFEKKRALDYVDYLIAQHDVGDAVAVWQETAQRCGLSAYLASGENLVVNPHFDSDVLNSGFDWRYRRKPNVDVALDPIEFHGGHRSLSVAFDGPGVDEAGIGQYVPVQPNTVYHFSAYYKAEAMDGAGGPRLSVEDAYAGTDYFSSDELRDPGGWREVNGQFKTGADAQLVVIRVLRIPMGSPIRGRLWLDDFRLIQPEIGS